MLQPVVARGGTGAADTIGRVWVRRDGATPRSASSTGSQSDVFWEKSNHLQSAATRLLIVYLDYLHMNHFLHWLLSIIDRWLLPPPPPHRSCFMDAKC